MEDKKINYKHPQNLSTNAIPGNNHPAKMRLYYGNERVNEWSCVVYCHIESFDKDINIKENSLAKMKRVFYLL